MEGRSSPWGVKGPVLAAARSWCARLEVALTGDAALGARGLASAGGRSVDELMEGVQVGDGPKADALAEGASDEGGRSMVEWPEPGYSGNARLAAQWLEREAEQALRPLWWRWIRRPVEQWQGRSEG